MQLEDIALPARDPAAPATLSWTGRKILIVADNASARFGGEAALPFHYFRVLRKMGVDVRMVTHARVRDELLETFAQDADRLGFIEDNAAQRLLWRLQRLMRPRTAYFTVGVLSRTLTQLAQRRVVRRLVDTHGIDLVHQPSPVSPREPSFMYDVGAPVLIGPLNGNMHYPPGFAQARRPLRRVIEWSSVQLSTLLNSLVPGKSRAAALLAANHRTVEALPRSVRGRVAVIPENGVDLQLWRRPASTPSRGDATARFVFMGRLVDWKAVDLLILAFAQASQSVAMALTILGQGPCAAALRALAARLGVLGERANEPGKVFFAGWQSQSQCAAWLSESDGLLLPSLIECGGAVVLEAMACALPVVATAWGGPLDYLTADTGILIEPSSILGLTSGFRDAMLALARDPARRQAMGAAARERIESHFDWDRKVDEVYRFATARVDASLSRLSPRRGVSAFPEGPRPVPPLPPAMRPDGRAGFHSSTPR